MHEETTEIKISPMPHQKRGGWYLLTGVVIGVILGLLVAWFINPVVYENTHPASLQEDHKNTYRSTIAQVFAATGNLPRATLRLALLQDADPVFTLGAQAQRKLAEGNTQEAHALALLASALQENQQAPIDLADVTPTSPTGTSPSNGVPTQTLPATTPIP